jgi:hypothetical protein
MLINDEIENIRFNVSKTSILYHAFLQNPIETLQREYCQNHFLDKLIVKERLKGKTKHANPVKNPSSTTYGEAKAITPQIAN